MMVQAQAPVRLVQVRFKAAQTLDIAAVQTDAQLILLPIGLVADAVIPLQIIELRG